MAATSYLPKSEVAKVQRFVQFTTVGTVDGFETDLNTEFGATAGFIQVVADSTTGRTANALVIVNDNIVFSVPPNSSASWFGGQWTQLTAAQLTSGFTQYFTS